jgi:predicted secreted hydrolase
LDLTTPLKPQELAGTTPLSPSYWEGAIRIAGTRGATPLAGVGYLEMTGYDHPIQFGQSATGQTSTSTIH